MISSASQVEHLTIARYDRMEQLLVGEGIIGVKSPTHPPSTILSTSQVEDFTTVRYGRLEQSLVGETILGVKSPMHLPPLLS